MDRDVHGLVDHLFRQEYAKLVATLTRIFGLSGLAVAEDLVQETLVAAMHYWSLRGVPDNPPAWLMQVAKNKALNRLKADRRKQSAHRRWAFDDEDVAHVDAFLASEIEDNMLRMVFACCHPGLSEQNQIGLILKTLCGFGSREAARALLTSEEAFNKRLYRAKLEIHSLGIDFEIPDRAALASRIGTVNKCLYLLFNEGYCTSGSEDLIRRDLCDEAMRLCALMTNRYPAEKSVWALLSLMCFHAARFDTRVAADGSLVVLDDQDRKAWDQSMIRRGLWALSESAGGDRLGRYHLEASIAAQHCTAPSFEQTNWRFILTLYEQLYEITRSPIVQLNIAIVTCQLDGAAAALATLEPLADSRQLKRYPLYHATLGELCRRQGEHDRARAHLSRALALTESTAERAFLQAKLDTLLH